MHSGFLSKKRLYFPAFLFVHARHIQAPPAKTMDDKGTEKDPKPNAHGQQIDKLETSGVTPTYLPIVISRPLR